MSDAQVTQGQEGSEATVGNDGGNQNGQDNSGNNAGNSTGNNSSGAGQGAAHVQIPDFTGVMTAIAALPEQIAKSVKEAVGTPAKPPASVQPAESGSNGTNDSGDKGGSGSGGTRTSGGTSTASGQPGKRRSFADWWING